MNIKSFRILFSLLILFAISSSLHAQLRYWVSDVAANWNSDNWSTTSNGAPDGAGPPTAAQHARFDANANGNCTLNLALDTITDFSITNYTGVIEFNGNSLRATGNVSLASGTIDDNNGGSELVVSSSGTATFSGTEIGVRLLVDAASVALTNTTFTEFCDIEKTAGGNNASVGGNHFMDTLILTNSSASGYFLLGNGSPDTFDNFVSASSTGSNYMYLSYAGTGHYYQGNVEVNSSGSSSGVRFGSNAGTSTMAAGNNITIGAGGFSIGYLEIRTFTQLGTENISLTTTGASTILAVYDCSFGGDVSISSARITTRGTHYGGTFSMTKTGAVSDASAGGNVIDGNATITNNGSGYVLMGNGTPDSFNLDLNFTNAGTYYSYLAYNSANNYVGGDLTLNNLGTGTTNYFYVSHINGTTLTIDGDVIATNNGTSSNSRIIFGEQGDISVTGRSTFVNTGSATTANIQVANNANSTVTFSGVAHFTNSGTATTSNLYVGNAGDITFGDSLYVINSSSATNSLAYCNYSTTSLGTYNGDIFIENSNAASDGIYFGSNGGSGTLASGEVVDVGPNGFVAGILYFRNFTQLGAGASTFEIATAATLTIYDCSFGGTFDADAGNITSRGTTYGGDVVFRKTGTVNDASVGGNVINGTTTLTNIGTGYFLWGNGSPDSFLGNVTVFDSSSYNFYIAHSSADNYIDGDLLINKVNTGTNTYTYVSTNSGSSLDITGGVVINDNSTSTNPRVYFAENGSVTIANDLEYIENANSTTAYCYFGTQTASYISIGGDASLSLGNLGTTTNAYFGNNGDVDLTGNLTLDNNSTTTTSQIYVANGSSSAVSIGGVTRAENNGAGTTRRLYFGNAGDVTFSDSLIIVNNSSATNSQTYLNQSATSSNAYNADILLECTSTDCDGVQFGNGGGSGTLAAGQTISIGANGFVGQYIYLRNFNQVGATAQSLEVSAGIGYIYNYTSSWGGDVEFTAPRMYTYSTNYDGAAVLEKSGASNDQSPGLNRFAGNTEMICSGTGYFMMGNGNPDSFLLDLSMTNTGTSSMYMAYNGGANYIGGDLLMSQTTAGTSSDMYACNTATTTLQIDGAATMINNSSASSASNMYLGNSGDVTLDGDLDISITGTATSAQMRVANNVASEVNIGGHAELTNNSTGTVTSRIYLGYWGDIILADSLIIHNNSNSTNSQVYLNFEDSSLSTFNGNIVLESSVASCDGVSFGENGGSATLASSRTVSVGSGGFVSGVLYFFRFDQISNTAQTIAATGDAYMYQFRSDWDGNVDFTAPRMRTDYTRYEGTASLEKTGATNDASVGGNHFSNNTTLTNSGSGYMMMGNGNPDTFLLDLDISNTGTNTFYLAQSTAGHYVGGDLAVTHQTTGTSSSMVIGNNAGTTLQIDGNASLTSNSSANSSNFYFANYTYITVGGDLDIIHTANSNTSQWLMAYQLGANLSVAGVTDMTINGSGNSSLAYIAYRGDATFSDSVLIQNGSSATTSEVRIAYEDSADVLFNGDVLVESSHASCDGLTFGASGGNCTLADGQRIVVGPNGHIAGALYFYRFHQVGNTTQSLTTTGTSYIYNFESDWEADLTLIGPRNRTDRTDYGGTLYFEKTGAVDEQGAGGNTVADSATLVCSGSGYMMWGANTADSLMGEVTMNNTGTRGMYLAYNQSGNYVGGNLTSTNTGTGATSWIYVSEASNAGITIDGNASMTNNGSGTTSQINFGNNGDVTLGGDLDMRNISTSTNAYSNVATGTNCAMTIGGVTTILNTGGVNNGYTYLGNNGDIVFADSVYILNSSSASNSLVYCNYSANGSSIYNGDIVVESSNASCDGVYFGGSNGVGTLAAGQTITVGPNGFLAGTLYMRNFTQTGATPQSLTLTGTATLNNYNSDWGGNVSMISPRFYTYSTRYRGTAYFEKTGANSDASAGLNRIDGVATLVNTGSGYFMMGNGNADSLMSDASFTNSGTHYMYFANNNSDSYIGGDLDITHSTTGTNTYMYISNSATTSIQIDGDVTYTCNSSATNPRLYFAEQGDITIDGDLTYTNTTSGTNSYHYFANGTNSSLSVGGVSDFNHSPTGATTHYLYVGSNGDITFADSVYASNNGSSTNNLIYFNNSVNSSNVYNGPIVIESYNAVSDGVYFGSSTGLGTLTAGNTVSIGPNGFSSGILYFRNFDQQGATAQSLSVTGASTRISIYDSEFDGDLDFDAPVFFTQYSDYNGDVDFEKTGTTSDQSAGGNTFNGDFIMHNSGTGYFMLPNNVADDYNGDVTYIKSSTGLLYPSYNATSAYAGNINFNTNSIVTFGASNGRIELDGAAAQSVNDLGTSTRPNFRRLTINNSTDSITLNMPIEVQTNVTFTDGILNTDTTNIIELRDNATATGASDASFVYGYVSKVGNDAFEFPVGDSIYRPISISNPSSGSATFRASYVYQNPAPTYAYGLVDAPIDHVSTREHWFLDRTNSTNNVNVTLSWNVNSGGVTNLTELLVARWDGDSWTSQGNGGTTGNTTAGTVITSAPVSNFSPFTLASTTTNNPLPIELIKFDATPKVDQVNLEWETAAEINNDYFTIERSSDGIIFHDLIQVTGAGSSISRNHYKAIDKNPLSGISFYRLKQTDYDGSTSLSQVEMISFTNDGFIQLFASKSAIEIEAAYESSEVLRVEVMDATGRLIISEQWSKPNGASNYRIDRSRLTSEGIYFVSIVGMYTRKQQRIYIQ